MADAVIDKSLVAQGVTDPLTNGDKTGSAGSPAPAAPSNDPPPKPEPTETEKAEAAAKEAADKVSDAAKATAETEKKAADDKEAEAKKDNTPLDEEVWGSTGDEVGDSVLTMLQNADVTTDEAKALLFDAVQAGDVTKIDVKALEDKVGKVKATLIMAGVTSFVEKNTAKNAVIVADMHKAAGGEDNWNTLAAWGKTNIPEAELSELRLMIDAGGAQARFAVSEIAAKFNADEGNTSLSTATTTPVIEADGGTGKTARSTSRADYVAELTRAHRDNKSDAVIAEITAARHRGRAAGI